MRTAAGPHDIGKILIPSEILEAPRKRTAQERELISNHASYGGHLLRRADAPEAVIQAAELHHHRFDGRGSDPDASRGMALPPIARLLMLADSLEAMAEVLRRAGGQFDPLLAEALLNLAPAWPASTWARAGARCGDNVELAVPCFRP